MNPFDLSGFHFIKGLAGQSVVLDGIMIALAKYAQVMWALLFVGAWFGLPRGAFAGRHALVWRALPQDAGGARLGG